MSYPVLASDAQPCVWMAAGVLRYRLCPRNLECEGCPLDAALRVRLPDRPGRTPAGPSWLAASIRPDRLYAPGHLWIMRRAPQSRVWRIGLDAFGAAAAGPGAIAVPRSRPGPVARDDLVCELRVGAGVLTLGSPVQARRLRCNVLLHTHPETLQRAPYDDGWILEVGSPDPDDLRRLADPHVARRRLAADLVRFRRALAARLLDDDDCALPHPIDRRPEPLDLPRLLGGAAYVELLRGFLH